MCGITGDQSNALNLFLCARFIFLHTGTNSSKGNNYTENSGYPKRRALPKQLPVAIPTSQKNEAKPLPKHPIESKAAQIIAEMRSRQATVSAETKQRLANQRGSEAFSSVSSFHAANLRSPDIQRDKRTSNDIGTEEKPSPTLNTSPKVIIGQFAPQKREKKTRN